MAVPKGSEYVRWLQSTLNRVMDLRLPVTGIVGPETRSAIRDFQSREGLPVDGIAGPETKQALQAAAKGPSVTGEPTEDGDSELEYKAWESEINRSSRDYIRWVQQSLNRILGLRLAVDGISGPQTRSAVRNFQKQRGLSQDGIVGPQTEAALIAAGAGRPPGGGRAAPAPTAPAPAPSSGRALRDNVARIARQELRRWRGGAAKESEPSMRPVLEDYWRTGVGFVPRQANWWSSVAWSAAFISWVMRKAGAGNAFRYSSKHTDYVGDAKRNRVAENSNPFKTYRITEVAPRVGDLVCKARSSSGVTYDNVDRGFRASHCDIVTEVLPGNLRTVGGNVSDSVKTTTVETNAKGLVTARGYYAVVRVGG